MAEDKVDITIHYCHLWGEALRAAWIAGEILHQFGDSVGGCRLVPSGHGTFHIYFNDDLVLQHSHNPHHWPEAREVIEKLREWQKARVAS